MISALDAMADRPRAVAVWGDELKSANALETARIIVSMLPHVESLAREKHGLNAYITDNLDEPPFVFSHDLLLRGYEAVLSLPSSYERDMLQRNYELALGNYAEADTLLDRARDNPYDDRRATAAHFSGAWIESRLMWKSHPPHIVNIPQQRCVFIGCDYKYFLRFGMSLARSLAAAPIHFHIFDLPHGKQDYVKEYCASMSWEDTGYADRPDARFYYASARLCRFYQIMNLSRVPMIFLDADMWQGNPMNGLWQMLDANDICLYRMPGRMQFHTQINASVVGVNPTANGLRFLFLVANYIMRVLQDGLPTPWCLDQIALHCVLRHMQREAIAAEAWPCHTENWFSGIFCPQKIAVDSPYMKQWKLMKEKWS